MARVLLVEDNEMNRDMLSRRLLRAGHTVSIAVDGQEAIDKAGAEAPEVVQPRRRSRSRSSTLIEGE